MHWYFAFCSTVGHHKKEPPWGIIPFVSILELEKYNYFLGVGSDVYQIRLAFVHQMG
jgi:hypothetical protein